MAERDEIAELNFTGALTEREHDLTQELLDIPPGGSCLIYFDSPGGNPYVGLSLMTLMMLRGVDATGIVTGECSSAALWPWAACRRRMVTPYSVLLFHPMKWQSEENVGLNEAAEWARHFGQLERTMDEVLADLFGVSKSDMSGWMQPGRYLTGQEIVDAGLAEMIPLGPLGLFQQNGAARRRKRAAGRG